MTGHVNEACLMAHLEAEMRHDMQATLATVHPACLFEDQPLALRLEGHAGARRHYEMWWSGFDVTLEEGDLHWVRDDLVVGDSTFVGRHIGLFAGMEATGRDIRLPFVVFVRFREGLIAGERFVYDLNHLLHQVGWPSFTPPDAASVM